MMPEQAEIEAFLLAEARLLDEQRWQDWLDLFADDGVYWIPAAPGQTDPKGVASIVYEDRTVLRMRIRRLHHPRAWSLQPLPRTSHLLGAVTVAPHDRGVTATCSLQVAAFRDGERQRFDGRQTMALCNGDDGLRILEKRIDLIDCDGIHSVMAVPI